MAKKIAFLNITQGGVERGAEVFVEELGKRLLKKYKVDVISDERRTMPDRWPVLWRCYLDYHGLVVLWFTLRNLPKIWREKYDVVIPVNSGWQPALVRLVTWFYGGKTVISGQSGKGWDDRNNLWCLPDVFVALTQDGLRWAKRACPFVRVECIPNGVDLKKFHTGGDKYKTGLKRPVVLCVAALVAEKRVEMVIESVAKIGSASLLVVGKGPLGEKIKIMGTELMCERFSLINARHEEMPAIYRACDVFVLVPRESEAFGIVYLEAMASGLPVVAIDDPIRREMLGGAGVFVSETGDVSKVAEEINRAMSMKDNNISRDRAEKFGWDEIMQKYEKLFTRV